MSLLRSFSSVITYGKKESKKKKFNEYETFDIDSKGKLYFGDNLDVMKGLLKQDMAGKIQSIYIDPPFFSMANYDAWVKEGNSDKVKKRAYSDVWNEGISEYLKMLSVRLYLMKELLSDTGTIWVHLDWHGSHYVKILMDEIFGEKNFINEIVWTYKSGGSSKKHFARKHDVILVYSKTQKYYLDIPKEKSYNRDFKPYRFKGVEEFQDEIGWYTMVNMKDVWSIDMVGRTSKERNGYATQKPEALLKRIVLASSKEGDIVADFFSGSSTLGKVALDNNRNFILADNSKIAIDTSIERLTNNIQIQMEVK